VATRISRDNFFAGGIFIALGGYFALESLNYELGSPIRMGPGYMPLVLGSLLAALGLAIIVAGLRKPTEHTGEPPSWRAIGLITVAIVFFGVSIRGLGFVPTVFITGLLTASASRNSKLIGAVIIAAALTLLSTLVFVIGLRLQVPMLGPWLRF
jgi:putative Mn2+ efflux pump MntP